MKGFRAIVVGCVVMGLGNTNLCGEELLAQDGKRPKMRISVSSTLFQSKSEPLVQSLMRPFGGFMEAQSGVRSEMVASGDGRLLARLLDENAIQIGVLEGIEFAWARQRYPQLKPLMLTVNQSSSLRACLVVPRAKGIKRFQELQGKSVAMHTLSRQHSWLFLGKLCQGVEQGPQKFFSNIVRHEDVEEALDEVVDDNVHAALVDDVALACYARRKPARFARLTTLEISEAFPASVIAYRAGNIDNATLTRFRASLLDVNKKVLGRQLLTLWKLSAFEPVPADFDETLTKIVKAYPAPTETSVSVLEITPASSPKK